MSHDRPWRGRRGEWYVGGPVLLIAGFGPRDGATLVQGGPFRIVRHPMYSGAILMALGWSLTVPGLLTLVNTLLLFVLLDMKSCREEGGLTERFDTYDGYQKRSRKRSRSSTSRHSRAVLRTEPWWFVR